MIVLYFIIPNVSISAAAIYMAFKAYVHFQARGLEGNKVDESRKRAGGRIRGKEKKAMKGQM